MRSRYEVWDAYVKFEESDEKEIHPVIIWNESTVVTIGYKVTSTNRGDSDEEMPITHWRECGLDHLSWARLTKQIRLIESDFIRKRGVLDERDQLRMNIRINRLISTT